VQLDEEDDYITAFFVTREGMCLNAKKDDIPVQGRFSGGVKGMNLKEGDEVIFGSQIDGEGEIVVATTEGRFKRVIAAQIDPISRNCKGVKIANLGGEHVIFANYVTTPYQLALVFKNGKMKEISTEDIPIDATNTRGRTVKGVKESPKAVFAMD
jgi:topoisomerase-4 subunit A